MPIVAENVSIDSLSIEIEKTAGLATSDLDALTKSLKKLGKGVASLNLETAVRQFETLGQGAKNISELANAAEKLGAVKISVRVSNQLNRVSETVRAMADIDTSVLEQIADSVEKIGNSTGNINSKEFENLTKRVQKLENTTKSAEKTSNSFWESFLNGSQKVQNEVSSLIKKVLSLQTAVKLFNIGFSLFTLSSQAIEALNLASISMATKELAESAKEYAEAVQESYGVDSMEFLKYQSTIMDISRSFGIATNTAYKMSKALTQLTYDYSSFYNISVSDAATKMQQVITGELEGIRRLGKDISVANLQVQAANLGISTTVDNMTQAEKAMLRTISVLKQSKSAMGDMSRTLDNSANQMRILNAQWTLFKRALGDLVLPLVQKALPYLIATAKVCREIVVAFAGLWGIELPSFDWSDSADNADSLADSVADAAEEVNKLYQLSFDELNILGTQSSSSDTASSLADMAKLEAELDRLTSEYDKTFSEMIGKTSDEITDKLRNWITQGKGIKEWASDVNDEFEKIKGKISDVSEKLKISFSKIGLDFSSADGEEPTGKINLQTLIGNGIGLALGISALGAICGNDGSLLAKGLGLALGIGAVKILLDKAKLGEVDSSENNGLIKSLKNGLVIALAGTSMSLLSGKGLTYSIPLGLSLASLYLGFSGVSALYDSSPDNDLQGAVQTAISGALLGSSLMLLNGASGLMYTLPIALSMLGVSVLFSGAKLLTNGKSDDNLQGILLTAIGVAVMGAAGAKAASLLGVSAASGGMVGLAVGFALSISFFLDNVGVYDKIGNWAKETGNVLKDKIEETLGKKIYTAGSLVETVIDTVNKAGEYAYDVISSVFDSKTTMTPETQSRVSKNFEDVGESIGDGITKGMENREKVLKHGSEKMAEVINAQFSEELGIHSPSTVFEEHGLNIIQGLSNGITENITIATIAFDNLYEAINIGFDSFADAVVKKAERLMKKLDKLFSGTSFNANISLGTSSKSYVPAYASGGIVEDGFFYANSNELVGRFSNGRTAVANNEQITTGIADAVYRAVSAAMRSSNGSGKVELVLDKQVVGRAFGAAIESEKRRSGANTKITFTNGGQ